MLLLCISFIVLYHFFGRMCQRLHVLKVIHTLCLQNRQNAMRSSWNSRAKKKSDLWKTWTYAAFSAAQRTCLAHNCSWPLSARAYVWLRHTRTYSYIVFFVLGFRISVSCFCSLYFFCFHAAFLKKFFACASILFISCVFSFNIHYEM